MWGAGEATLGGVGAMRGDKSQNLAEPFGIGVSEGRRADPGGDLRRGVRLDVAANEASMLCIDGCSVVPSGAGHNQWRAHRCPRFLPDP
jgi:hypothetical protein